MKVSPFLVFNGNCSEAIALYEKAFGTKTNYLCKYKDTDIADYPLQPGTEELIMHAVLPIGSGSIYLCDTTPDQPTAFGDGAFPCVELDSAEAVMSAYELLKEGGKVFCEAQEVFWNKCYAEIEDKFGIKWSIMMEE